jgi:hypothetical protein
MFKRRDGMSEHIGQWDGVVTREDNSGLLDGDVGVGEENAVPYASSQSLGR